MKYRARRRPPGVPRYIPKIPLSERGIDAAIANALDPDRRAKKVKSMADMTPEEQAEMVRLYEKKR